jgi:hypothetical protein
MTPPREDRPLLIEDRLREWSSNEDGIDAAIELIDEAEPELRRLRASREALIGALQKLEWCEIVGGQRQACPACGNNRILKHSPMCWLQAALDAARAEEEK